MMVREMKGEEGGKGAEDRKDDDPKNSLLATPSGNALRSPAFLMFL